MNKIKFISGYLWKVCFAIGIAVLIYLSFVSAYTAETAKQSSPEASQTAEQSQNLPDITDSNESSDETQNQVTSTPHAVTQAALKLGVLSSLQRIDQVSKFLTNSSRSGVLILPSRTDPDEHLFSTSLEAIRPDNTRFYASASFAPNQDAVYDTVEYVEMSWEKVESTIFKDLKREGVLKENIVILDGGAVKVFLMPAGSGCVVIKKEIVR